MSTIRVNAIQNTNTTAGGIGIDGSGHVTIEGQSLPSAGPLSNRNLIINGAMQVAQRGTAFNAQGSGDSPYTLDRFQFSGTGSGAQEFNITQNATAPDDFAQCLRIACSTANASPSANDLFSIIQKIEAQDLQILNYGSAAAKKITLSFYVRSNVTGTYAILVYQNDDSRMNVVNYTVDSANTWERKTITINEDTTGVIDDNNQEGLMLEWVLSVGSNFTGSTTKNTWGAYAGANRASGHAVNIGSSTSNTFDITGVQLEVGSVATPFEHRSYGDELARCQRYYYRHADGSQNSNAGLGSGLWYLTTDVYISIHFPTTMRANPTLKYNAPSTTSFRAFRPGASSQTDDLATQEAAPNCSIISMYNMTGGTAGQACWCQLSNASAYVAFEAEL